MYLVTLKEYPRELRIIIIIIIIMNIRLIRNIYDSSRIRI